MNRLLLCTALGLVLTAALLPAQPPAARKHALLVGINEYQHARLPALAYAEADVTELAKVLKGAGYQVTLLTGSVRDEASQPTKANIEKHLQTVLRGCKRGDTVILAFSGHGLQFEGKKDAYFCPQDARPLPVQTETLVSLSKVYEELDGTFAGMKVLLVDACRNDPDAERGTRSGLNADSAPRPPQGVAALFSCRAGEKAYETDKLGHGVFFYHVLQGLRGKARDAEGEVTFAALAGYVSRRVAKEVPALIGGEARQSPNLKADYSTEPVLVARAELERVVADTPTPLRLPFGQARARDAQQAWAKYLGRKVEEDIDLGEGVKMTFVLIPPGTFTMGSFAEEIDRVLREDRTAEREWYDNEKAHEVTLTKPFYLGKYEVTRGQFRRFVDEEGERTEAVVDRLGGWGYDEASGKFLGPTFDHKTGEHSGGEKTGYYWQKTGFAQTDRHPVVNVSWNDAQAFCRWLGARGKRQTGLPSEALWEWACRAGSAVRYHFGDDSEELARYANVADGTAKKKFSGWTTIAAEDGYVFTAPVGSFLANGFGLHDMHGNAWEWCQDWYGPSHDGLASKDPLRVDKGSYTARVLRGGSWGFPPRYCRAANRSRYAPAYRTYILGFRVAFRLD